MSTKDSAATILRAFNLITRNQVGEGRVWVKITHLAEMADLPPSEMSLGIRHLAGAEDDVEVMPEANQKTLTAMDRLYRVHFAGQDNDLFSMTV